MRVGMHFENAITQPAAGLVALLTGTPKEAFASLLKSDAAEQPELDNPELSQRKQGDRRHRTPQDRTNEHPHKSKSSEDRDDSTVLGLRQVGPATVKSQPELHPEEPRWGSGQASRTAGASAGGAEPVQGSSAQGSSVQERAIRSGAVGSIGPTRWCNPEREAVSALAVSDGSAKDAARVISDGSDTKIPRLTNTAQLPDSDRADAIPGESGGATRGVQDDGVALPNNDAVMGVVESATGRHFATDLVVSHMRQSDGMEPVQLKSQRDSIDAAAGQEADRMPSGTHNVENNQVAVGGVGQPEAHGQSHHDMSGQALKDALTTGASRRTTDGTTFELVRAGQSDGAQRRSLQTDNGPGKSAAAAGAPSRGAGLQHVADASASRMLANAMRGELHVGLHTETFGRVTIQTSTGAGQMSAQVSLEDSKQSAALAAHLPAVEQKILQQHGLDASVRIVSASHTALAGGSIANGQRGSSANDGARSARRGAKTFERAIAPASNLSDAEATGERHGRILLRGRLDVTV